MSGKFKSFSISMTAMIIFILRNLILLSLLLHAYLHFKDFLNPIFLSISFCLAILLALWMEKIRLRFLPALIAATLVTILLRFVFFLIFTLLAPLDPGIEKDFIFFQFDKDFFPSLVPCFITWLFNFLALRKRGFIHIETGINSLLLILIFFNQANYNITFYHPTFFGIYLTLFILVEIAVLVLSRREHNRKVGTESEKKEKKRTMLLSYLWIIIPLILLLIFYLFLMNKYNEEATKNRGGLMESTLFRFDFSKYIKLQSEIKLSDDLVLLFRKNGPAQRILLRRFVLSDYKPESGFYQSTKKGIDDIPMVVPDIPTTLPDPGYEERERVGQEYFFINLDPTSLIAMNYPVKITPLKNWDDSSFLRIYRVESEVSQLDLYEDIIHEKPIESFSPEEYAFYTNYGGDEKIKALAEEVTEYFYHYLDKVLAIRDYLRDEYLYSLKPGIAVDGDQLHHFLFTGKKGYCSYFAFSMALMCRSIGIPARVAVGFFANPDWEVLNFYEIRANQAHAWVEVFFEDFGWIEFDPTSSNIAPGEDISFMFGFQLDDRLKNLIYEILENQDKLVEEEGKKIETTEALSRFSEIIVTITSWLFRYWFITLPCLYLLIIVILKCGTYMLYLTSTSPRKKIKCLFLFSLGFLYGLHMTRKIDESLVEYAKRLEESYFDATTLLSAWTGSYLKAVFGDEFSETDCREAEETYHAFRKIYKQKVAICMRVLGFFNPVNSLKRKV